MNLRKRIFALIMSLAMVLTYMPGMAFAASEDPGTVDETVSVEENVDTETAEAEEAVPAGEDAPGADALEAPAESVPETPAEKPAADEEALELTAPAAVQSATTEADIADNDELLMQYMQSKMPSAKKSVAKKARRVTAGSRLTGNDAAVYTLLKSELSAIASGERNDATITLALQDINPDLYQDAYSAEDLGVSSIVADGDFNQEALDAMNAMYSFDWNTVLDALLFDMPYDLYWFDKTSSTFTTSPQISASHDGTEYLATFENPYITFYFSGAVAEEYRGESAGSLDVDGGTNIPLYYVARTDAVEAASVKAAQLVDKYAASSDLEKLEGYRDEICDLTSYNDAAADDANNTPYGNPWQLIWALDGDTATEVVCEGYSKAFQFLCDSTDFSDSRIECISVTGDMDGGTGAGAHMWNIVSMDDNKSYLVDVTNSDAGTIGEGGYLFLKGALAYEDYAGDIAFDCDGKQITYKYYDETLNSYDEEQLAVATSDYAGPVAEWWSINTEDTVTEISVDADASSVNLEVLLNIGDVEADNKLTAEWYAGHNEEPFTEEPLHTETKSGSTASDFYGFAFDEAPLTNEDGQIDFYRCYITEKDSEGNTVKEDSIDISLIRDNGGEVQNSWYINWDDTDTDISVADGDSSAYLQVLLYAEGEEVERTLTAKWYGVQEGQEPDLGQPISTETKTGIIGTDFSGFEFTDAPLSDANGQFAFYRCIIAEIDEDGIEQNVDSIDLTLNYGTVEPGEYGWYISGEFKDRFYYTSEDESVELSVPIDFSEFDNAGVERPELTYEWVDLDEYEPVGNDSTYLAPARFGKYRCSINDNNGGEFDAYITVMPEPKTAYSMTFSRGDGSDAYEIYENTDGYWTSYTTDDEVTEYYVYHFQYFSDGDTLTLYASEDDETGTAYVYESYNETFVNPEDSGDVIHAEEIYTDSNQSFENRWLYDQPEGSVYEFTMKYGDLTATFPARIIRPDFDTIELTRNGETNQISLFNGIDSVEEEGPIYDEDGSFVENRKYDYYRTYFKTGDILTLKGSEGDKTYRLQSGDEDDYFVNVDDPSDRIYEWNVEISTTGQSAEEPWEVDGVYNGEITYLGVSSSISFVIKANPIKGIELTRADGSDSYDLIEEYGGWWEDKYTYDENGNEQLVVDEEGNPVRWFCYDFPDYDEGDKLVVNKNDALITYEFKNDHKDSEGYTHWGFVNVNDPDDIINQGEINRDDNQSSENPWLREKPADADYYFEFTYAKNSCRVSANIIENPVSEIRYTRDGKGADRENPIELVEGVDGINSDGGDGEFFEYRLRAKAGDILTVLTNLGDTVEYIAQAADHDEDYVEVFKSADGETIDRWDIDFYGSDQSAANEWKPDGTVHEMTAYYMGRENNVYVKVVENPIQSVSFVRPGLEDGAPVEFIENYDGYEEDGEFTYEFNFKPGDELYVTYSGIDEPVKYVAQDDGDGRVYEFAAEGAVPEGAEETIIASKLFDGETHSWFTPSEGETEGTVTLGYKGRYFDIPVKVVPSPVEAVEFYRDEVGETITLTEGIDGYTTYYGEDEEIETFVYELQFFDGDTINLKFKNAEVTYKYGYDSRYGSVFKAEGSDLPSGAPAVIYERNIKQITDQSESNIWETGAEKVITLNVLGKECSVNVLTAANPVESISFTRPGKTVELVHGVDGYVDVDGFYYELNREEGDIFTVKYSDFAQPVNYVAKAYSNGYVYRYEAENADSLPNNIPAYLDRYAFYGWNDTADLNVGDTDELYIEYKGRSCTVPFVVVANPVESISFVRDAAGETINLTEGEDTHYTYYQDGRRIPFYEIGFVEGDKFIVKFTAASEPVTYVLNKDYDFVAEGTVPSGAPEIIDANSIEQLTDQSDENLWKADSNHVIELSYSGRQYEVNVHIIPSDVESWTFSREGFDENHPIELVQRADGWEDPDTHVYSYSMQYKEGDTATVKYTDGRTVTYVYQTNKGFVSSDEEYVSIRSDSGFNFGKEWVPGDGTHTMYLSIEGREIEVPVVIVENPVDSISFEKAGYAAGERVKLKENVDGWSWKDEDGNEHFIYDLRYITAVGDTFTINYTNGTSATYVFQYGTGYVNTEDPKDIIEDLTSYQDGDEEWSIDDGKDHQFIIKYLGRTCTLPVEIVKVDPEEIVHFEAVEPTCAHPGHKEYWTKDGKYYEDAECTKEIEEDEFEAKIIIAKLDHTPGAAVHENEVAATCTAEGGYDEVVYCSVCGEEISRTHKTTEKAAHTPAAPVRENEVAASCAKEGSYDEVVYCSVCHAEISRVKKSIPKTEDHTAGEVKIENQVEGTCAKEGSYDEVVYCVTCGKEISRTTKTTPKTGVHAWGEPVYMWADDNSSVTAKRVCKNDPSHVEEETVKTTSKLVGEPTCEKTGLMTYKAEFTNSAFAAQTKDVEQPALNHAWKEWTSVDDSKHQRICGNDPSHVEEAAHTWDAGTVTTPATETEEGLMTFTCTECGHTRTEVIPVLAPDKVKEALDDAEAQADKAEKEAADAEKAAETSTNEEDVKAAREAAEQAVELAAAAEAAAEDAVAAAEQAVKDLPADATTAQKEAAQKNLNVANQNLVTAKKLTALANTTLATTKKAAAKVASNKAAAAQAAAQNAATAEEAAEYQKQAAEAAAEAQKMAGEAETAKEAADAAAKDITEIADKMADTADAETKAAIEEAKKAASDAASKADAAAGDAGKASEEAKTSEAEAANAAEGKQAEEDLEKTKVGTVFTAGGSKYKVLTNATDTKPGTVALTYAKNTKTFKVPKSVTCSLNGKTFNVTQLAANAFKKGTKIRTVYVGANVSKMAAKTFYKSKATKLILQTKKLTKSSTVKKALTGSKIKQVQVKVGSSKVNKQYVKKYKKVFTKKIVGVKVTVK